MMIEFKHTPAPWAFSKDFKHVYAENNNDVIAHLTGRNFESNGALIASAPELLDALLEISREIMGADHKMIAKLYKKANKAINKAKGENDDKT